MISVIFILSLICSCQNNNAVLNNNSWVKNTYENKQQDFKNPISKKWDTLKGYFNDDIKEDLILSSYNISKGEFYYKVLLQKESNYLVSKTDTINEEFSYLINEGKANIFIYDNSKGSYGIRISCCASTKEYEEYIYSYNNKSKVWVLETSFEYTRRPKISFDITYPKEKDIIYYEKQLDDLLKTTQTKFKEKNFDWIEKEINDLFLIGKITHNVSLNSKNINKFNDLAYFLEQTEKGDALAIYLLEKIIKEFPNRTVAYINLGDAYWGLGEKVKAKEAYKTYIDQMKTKGKESKIPEVVLERGK